MFAINAEAEALFAKGYPHLRLLESPHPDEADAAKWAEVELRAFDPERYHVRWPREVAVRFVRAMGAKRRAGGRPDNIVSPDAADETAQLQKSGPVTEQEARTLIRQVADNQSTHQAPNVEHHVLLLEAMVGGAPLLDEVLTYFESMSSKELTFGNPIDVSEVAYALGFVLTRVPAAAAKTFRARMERFVATKPPCTIRERFQHILGGVKGIEESGWAAGIHIGHFVGDPEFLLENAHEGPGTLDLQIAFQGGEKVLKEFEKQLRGVPAWRLPFLVEELALVASPTAVKMLKALTKKKSVAKAATAALAARSGKTAPVVAKAKKPDRTKLEADAERRFEALSEWTAKQLKAAKGNAKKEAATMTEAVARYGDIRSDLELAPDENVVHFFGADGCGFGKQRTPAFLRAKPSDATLKRWLALLD